MKSKKARQAALHAQLLLIRSQITNDRLRRMTN